MSARDLLSLDDSPGSHYSSDEEVSRGKAFSKRKQTQSESESEDELEPSNQDTNGGDEIETDSQDEEDTSATKPLTKEEMEARMKAIKRSGVVYLSSVPPYMKPAKVRQLLSRFGEVNRLFLNPETATQHSRRIKAGGNKKKKYTEGWVEFRRKRDAKLAADTLNGQKIGGKKGSFYYDDIMNIKYLHRFKWTDLTEQMAIENQERHERLKAEIALSTKENKIFMENVERKATIDKIEAKKGRAEDRVRRTFTQRPSKASFTGRAPEEDVLSKIF